MLIVLENSGLFDRIPHRISSIGPEEAPGRRRSQPIRRRICDQRVRATGLTKFGQNRCKFEQFSPMKSHVSFSRAPLAGEEVMSPDSGRISHTPRVAGFLYPPSR